MVSGFGREKFRLFARRRQVRLRRPVKVQLSRIRRDGFVLDLGDALFERFVTMASDSGQRLVRDRLLLLTAGLENILLAFRQSS